MRSFTAIFIHADTDWRLPLIARSAPRPSVCGGRRRVPSVRHNLPYILALPLRGSPQIDMTMPAGTLTRQAVPGNPARRHDRGVGDPQAGNAMNAKLRTDDCHLTGSHLAADRMRGFRRRWSDWRPARSRSSEGRHGRSRHDRASDADRAHLHLRIRRRRNNHNSDWDGYYSGAELVSRSARDSPRFRRRWRGACCRSFPFAGHHLQR